jgi:hypothetical protein
MRFLVLLRFDQLSREGFLSGMCLPESFDAAMVTEKLSLRSQSPARNINHHVRQNGGITTMLKAVPVLFHTPSLLA